MINKKWNGTDCIVDFDSYCSSLTEEYREKRNDSRIEVYFDGDGCFIKYPPIESQSDAGNSSCNTTANGTCTEAINGTSVGDIEQIVL